MKVKVLSLFDGISCGMIAMEKVGINVDEYIAYETDKYAIETSKHNLPFIKEMGNVFDADFSQYKNFDFLIGGSPCTYWTKCKKENREKETDGVGWLLFSQYVRALYQAKPKFFIYENNKTMNKNKKK